MSELLDYRKVKTNRVQSDYNSPILEIYIKNKKVPFKIHKATLESKSTFLKKVKPIDRPLIIPHRAGRDDFDVKSESQATVDEPSSGTGKILAPNDQIFDLTHSKIRAETFTIFADYLYNKYPSPIHNPKEAEMAIRAYLIAVEYECSDLQNAILDRMRDYHLGMNFDLDLLILIVNRHGDLKCNMTQYLIRQFAYDISDNGYNAFGKSNKFLEYFLTEKDREVRRDVFKAVVEIAEKSMKKERIQDPAKRVGDAECMWHTHPNGVKCSVKG